MKLASFRAGGVDRVGVLVGDRLIDVLPAMASCGAPELRPRTLLELIEAGEPALAAVRRIAAGGRPETDGEASLQSFSPDEVTWHAPVRRPSKICCLALN